MPDKFVENATKGVGWSDEERQHAREHPEEYPEALKEALSKLREFQQGNYTNPMWEPGGASGS